MRILVLILLPWLAIFLQSTIFSFYTIKGTTPDLVLVFVTFFALFNTAKKGSGYAFFCGLLEDLYMGRFIGLNALSKGLTAYIVGKVQGNVFKENIFVGVLGVLVAMIKPAVDFNKLEVVFVITGYHPVEGFGVEEE